MTEVTVADVALGRPLSTPLHYALCQFSVAVSEHLKLMALESGQPQSLAPQPARPLTAVQYGRTMEGQTGMQKSEAGEVDLPSHNPLLRGHTYFHRITL